jgi:hypothetical protein
MKKTRRRASYVSEQSREKESSSWIKHNHLKENIIGKLDEGMRLRKRVINRVSYVCYFSQTKPKKVEMPYKMKVGSMSCMRS